jgi:hypothetical protein
MPVCEDSKKMVYQNGSKAYLGRGEERRVCTC